MERRKADDRPVTIIIFGASGDLTERKLVPAFHLFQEERLPANTHHGFSRRPYTDQHFRDLLRESACIPSATASTLPGSGLPLASTTFRAMPRCMRITPAEPSCARAGMARQTVSTWRRRLLYPHGQRLGAVGMAREEDGWRRIIVESRSGMIPRRSAEPRPARRL